MFILAAAFLFFFLAGPALAFDVKLGTQTLPSTELLNFNFNVFPMTDCSSNCTSAKQTINACADDTCFCSADTVQSFLNCQQCMYQSLIAANKPMPDFRAGSTPLLAAYATACNATGNPLKPAPALTVPPFWDGNFGQFVPIGGVVFTVGAGVFLGTASILMLSTM